ncbi:hypothetical protein EC973_008489 [Apophysomyces ossiformis]|uniref:K Homology domain-containing protein n=1 Tax=Apophysomyces ossiformis TaxID=679940 RepID=A0A8H7BMW7_9FUNG|nr:hypothetical protein EC973_008489 [Apophysomyces ossiformis]
MTECWKLKTREQQSLELKQKRLNTVSYEAEASREELFFVIGDNGATLREIEAKNEVSITINVANYRYTVSGTPEAIERAKVDIREHLQLFHRELDLPPVKEQHYYSTIEKEMKRMLVDISKASGVFIVLENGKFSMAGRSEESLEHASRLLKIAITELSFSDKRSLAASDYIAIETVEKPSNCRAPHHPYVLLPLHDEQAMPLVARGVGWSRISRVKSEEDSEEEISMNQSEGESNSILAQYQLLEAKSSSYPEDPDTIGCTDLKDILSKALNVADSKDDIALEATFGHLLLRNVVADPNSNILQPSMRSPFDASRCRDLLSSHPNGRRLFFGSTPPYHIHKLLAPLPHYAGFHRRSVKVEYVGLPLVAPLGDDPNGSIMNDLQRLELHFLSEENGGLQLRQVVGEHGRTAIDLINVCGNVDVRLLARRYTQFSRVKMPSWIQSLVDSCNLTSYSDLSCPNFWKRDSDLMLLDVSFRNEARYLLKDNLVTITHIESQDGRTRHSELTVTPVMAEVNTYPPVSNGLDRWESFTETIHELANRWNYLYK